MEQRKRLIPEIECYEEFTTGDIRWLPYVMFFNRTDFTSSALNTDSAGFRVTHGPAGPASLDALPDGPVNVLLGASPAFGFGSSSDHKTISSFLSNGPSGTPWLNFGAPALNSTQELILFMLHRHELPQPRDVVVFSGLNNLITAGLPNSDKGYGQFFFSGEFFTQLGVPEMAHPQWGQSALARVAEKVGLRGKRAEPEPKTPSVEERIDIAIRNLRRDLDVLRDVVTPTGARLHFALQPTLPWTGKPYSTEEKLLIEADEKDEERAAMWALFNAAVDPAVHKEYAGLIEKFCADRDIPFIDTNKAVAEKVTAEQWIFFDKVHLTDDGNELVAAIITAELDL
ncbi:hypothetical protein EV193_11652 [Herbihabitans rhizosphaerae]|uniref:GDSL-like lipase/acylhydrolase family protein n=1 Tax=Herbihabitans rhizosphaerae TaxID=1872711 RepID=A0A4V2ERE1_9PSEU|nr:IopA [Herbihabitans rhizosphaerae]RZS30532.1 hypothetical protein EV193_11652 [Herbihabitans rhizosphaerae]